MSRKKCHVIVTWLSQDVTWWFVTRLNLSEEILTRDWSTLPTGGPSEIWISLDLILFSVGGFGWYFWKYRALQEIHVLSHNVCAKFQIKKFFQFFWIFILQSTLTAAVLTSIPMPKVPKVPFISIQDQVMTSSWGRNRMTSFDLKIVIYSELQRW